jgi:hypothetical protein
MRIPEDEDTLRRGDRWLKIIGQDIAFKGLDRRKNASIPSRKYRLLSALRVICREDCWDGATNQAVTA